MGKFMTPMQDFVSTVVKNCNYREEDSYSPLIHAGFRYIL